MKLTHKGTRTIETERLILRKFRSSDFEYAYKNWVADKEVTKYLSWQPHDSIDMTSEIMTEWIENYANKKYYNWAIVPKDYGQVIGCIAVRDIGEEDLKGETGFCIGREFWNKGYTTEALRAIIHYMLFDVNLNRLQAIHNINNKASGKVMLKAGMRYEATLREYSSDNSGTDIDHLMYSALREDIFYAINNPELIQVGILTDGEIELQCVERNKANIEKGYAPFYTFNINLKNQSEPVGKIRLRIGFSNLLYYNGHIGYNIDQRFRGSSYSAKACQLISQLAMQHGIKTLLITTDPENIASRKICKKIGARLIRIVDIPIDSEMYATGERRKCIYQWDIRAKY